MQRLPFLVQIHVAIVCSEDVPALLRAVHGCMRLLSSNHSAHLQPVPLLPELTKLKAETGDSSWQVDAGSLHQAAAGK